METADAPSGHHLVLPVGIAKRTNYLPAPISNFNSNKVATAIRAAWPMGQMP